MIQSNIKRLFNEPLLHFLLIGFLLFLLYDLKQGQVSEAPNRIVVTASKIEQLSARFKLTQLRPPVEAELQALIEDYVRDEVFYKEAVAMGLDQNDAQVRKRMRMKLEYFLEELSTDTITDETLENYLNDNADKFQTDSLFAFQQVYINPEKHQGIDVIAKSVLLKLNSGADPDTLGDRTQLPADFSLLSATQINNYLGENFAEQLGQLKTSDSNKWFGPVVSSYGLHLVKVSEYFKGKLPTLSEIRQEVEREYTAQRRVEQKKLAYQVMRERYDIVIEPAVSKPELIDPGSSGE